jgi:hypothetical protein
MRQLLVREQRRRMATNRPATECGKNCRRAIHYQPPAAEQHYVEEALGSLPKAWTELPAEFRLTLVWLRSLLAQPALEHAWFALIDQAGTTYLAREILRGLPAAARTRYLSGQPADRRAVLAAHVWDTAQV